MSEIKTGQPAPFFEGFDQDGKKVTLADFKGKKLVIYFYPKDDTPGCTAEACSLRDNYDILTKNGIAVIGVSADSQASHQKFKTKHQLPFTLISDSEKKMLKDYNAWGEKSMYGKKYEGVLRKTYLIDEKGTIIHIIEKVDTKNHAKQISQLLMAND